MIELKNFCEFLDSKINTSEIEKNTYVSTENMLQNKAGICVATNLPDVLSVSSFQKNDILISNIRPYFKKIYYAKFDGGCSNDVLVFRAKENTDSKFLYYVLSDDKFFDYATATAKGTKMPRGDKVAIMKYSVPNFDIAVQKRIAGILGALDDRIDVLRRENVVLEQMAQAVFQSWFVDFDIVRAKAAGTPESEVCEKYHITPELYALFPSALTPDNLPLGWEKKKLGDLAFNASETHTAQGVEKLIFINTSDVENGVFLHNKYSVRSEMPGQAKKSIKENDILYSEIRPINKHFAFVNFDSKDYIVSTKFMIIRSFDINNVFYIYFFLTLKETLNSFQALAENRSGTFPQITFESISKTEIVFSNRELHWYFSDYLKKTYTKIFENEKQIRALSATRDALLPKLMNGEIEV
ncbi:MAG: restriction endonuclease subunit S [Acetobacter sp.]|nr:restriction endonuclease subunit S [Acetobacter sp.]